MKNTKKRLKEFSQIKSQICYAVGLDWIPATFAIFIPIPFSDVISHYATESNTAEVVIFVQILGHFMGVNLKVTKFNTFHLSFKNLR